MNKLEAHKSKNSGNKKLIHKIEYSGNELHVVAHISKYYGNKLVALTRAVRELLAN